MFKKTAPSSSVAASPADGTRKHRKPVVVLGVLFAVVLVASVAGCVYYYRQYQALKNDPNVQNRQESAQILEDLSRLMLLPDGQEPIFAKVLDKEKLKDQPFFQRAENGDTIVIFPSTLQAVLYRSSIKRIIDIAPASSESVEDQAVTSTRARVPSSTAERL